MCFELDSLPPIPSSRARRSRTTISCSRPPTATASRRSRRRPTSRRVCVVVLPDVRGLYRFYEELALRFAERGYRAVAFDYFGRTAGVGKRGDDFEYMEHVAADDAGGNPGRRGRRRRAPTLAAAACGSIFTVGFCFGGRNSWLAAAGGHGLAGAVGFYGNPGERNGAPGPTQRAAEIEAPILALQAGDDQNITAEDERGVRRARSTAAGVEHELVTYDGAPHSFFDRSYEELRRRVCGRVGTRARVHRPLQRLKLDRVEVVRKRLEDALARLGDSEEAREGALAQPRELGRRRQHRLDRRAVAAERHELDPVAPGLERRAATSAAASTSARACSSRRRRKRFADEPPFLCRFLTKREPTFEATSCSPSKTPAA